MTALNVSLPRATELREFYANPLEFLARARAALGEVVVMREDGPLFSRSLDCSGVIAVFGAAYTEAVLTDSAAFGLPISAAEHHLLPPNLINLNRGLHSMRGQQHDEHQRLLLQVFSSRSLDATHETIDAGLKRFVRGWSYDDQIHLLDEMRRLTLVLSTSLLFDGEYEDSESLAALARKYFHTRREVMSAVNSPDETSRTELIALGSSLDSGLRSYIGWCREREGSAEGLVAKLASLKTGREYSFSDDEAVAHTNVTFMSTNEPIAIALTWTLLILSQIPELRHALRNEEQSALLNSVVNESLRLFTPNALMSRITTRATLLGDVSLPGRCEVVLCPLLAHRDATVFPQPAEFLPSRWQSTKPSTFEYFPFGAGGHACIGRSLGVKIIKTAIDFLLHRYELVLAFDQEIDWSIDIIFSPVNDPIMTVRAPAYTHVDAGTLHGPVTELFSFNKS